MLKIEEGKTYRDANGGKQGPMKDYHETDGYPFSVPDEDCGWWSEDGRAQPDSMFPGVDLIAEWTDGPVVTETVTKTRIVPGTYGRLAVNLTYATEPSVGIKLVDRNGKELGVDGAGMTADELDAAAAVLYALAKGLRDV